ncbi:translation initiation factor IF-1, putative [Babesia ovis]|uniref:Translation initiation factor IF-1, putative n=1 Tax=Babesia ovis TaxID=5869 RepID=A0A9W5WVZ2_BABOV|nr:translation initiation factor IF-1, putative [Babesia ovis]
MLRNPRAGTYAPVLIIILLFVTLIDAYRISSNTGISHTRRKVQPLGSKALSLGPIVKGNKVQAYGHVVECRGGASYLVQIENSDKTVLCELGGNLYRRRKLLTINTKVKIEVHLLAPDKGRIVERVDTYEQLFSPSRGKGKDAISRKRGNETAEDIDSLSD